MLEVKLVLIQEQDQIVEIALEITLNSKKRKLIFLFSLRNKVNSKRICPLSPERKFP